MRLQANEVAAEWARTQQQAGRVHTEKEQSQSGEAAAAGAARSDLRGKLQR